MRKIGLICLAMVLAMGMLGAAFASWTDIVVVEEKVMTGTVCVGIRDVGTDDPGPDGITGDIIPGSGTLDPVLEGSAVVTSDKNVASCDSANVTEKGLHGTDQFYAQVTETISNAYPCYSPTITIEVANCGSIPVICTHMTESVVDPNGLNKFVELLKWEILDAGSAVLGSGSGETELGNFLATEKLQIDPCDVITIKLTKHILQDVGEDECPQGGTVTFTETIHFVQWNKA